MKSLYLDLKVVYLIVIYYIHRRFQVLRLYLILGVQDLLRLRFYVISVRYSHDSDGMRHYRMYIFLAECRRLSMVSPCRVYLILLFRITKNIIHRQWTSFLAAASTAGYVYIYSFYYFFFKTK